MANHEVQGVPGRIAVDEQEPCAMSLYMGVHSGMGEAQAVGDEEDHCSNYASSVCLGA